MSGHLRNKILVLGRRGVGKLSLVKKILELTSQEFRAHEPNNHSGLKVPWNITTRYYVADVLFWIEETDDVNQQILDEYMDEENGIGRVVDAIIFVFQKDKVVLIWMPTSFDDIKMFLPFFQKYEPSILLAVGSGTSVLDPEDNVYNSWCLSNGFEYIDLEVSPSVSDESAGLMRILEALQSHVWDGFQRIQQNEIRDNEAYLDSNAETDPRRFIQDMNPLSLNQNADENVELFGDILPTEAELDLIREQLFGDLDDDDGLDRVLTRLHSLRERGQSLPDDERRRLAASVAWSFGMQFGGLR
ncbi:9367_t:CDS:2 [Paraglomus occultum]|uniref:9367_t:CDS:1 n=1 Tax=Paraglomus occultum TaxID=144539 RepID=A0A9N8ZBS3_9GLOM|nr:9367_t:CDS:2 [Paraglomus occultum]